MTMDNPYAAPTLTIDTAAWPVWRVCALASLAAAAATELYGLAARAIGIPMAAGNPGGAVATPITTGMFAMAVFISAFWGTILAVALGRFAAHPATSFLRTALVLTVLSLAGPVFAGDTALSTKLMLCGAHAVAAAIVIPAVTHRLSHLPEDSGRHPASSSSRRS